MKNPVITIKNLSFSYKNTLVLKDINLTIAENEFLALIGPNGGGKSTLLKLILGLLRPTHGTLHILGLSPDKASRHIGYVPQNPNIQIDFRDDLDFAGGDYLQTSAAIPVSARGWDSRKIGAGPPPLLTEEGWLLIYYGVDDAMDDEYHIGAMLLDLKQPEKILYRSSAPILAPDEVYENEGYKSGVIYSCGAVVVDDTLLVYYGAADTVGCVASADLKQFLSDLKKNSAPRLKKKVILHEE